MKKYSLIVSTLILVTLFVKLLSNYSERFDVVENHYVEKSSINLVKGVSSDELSDVLYIHNYIPNKDDADFVSKFISQKLEDGQSLSTLYDFNKRIWQIPVSLIDSIGSNAYKIKANNSRESIGNDKEYSEIEIVQLRHSITVNPDQSGVINVSVIEKLGNVGFLTRNVKPCANVIVRLSEQYIDSLDNYKSERRTIAYLKTNENGEASFNGLNPHLSYSVLPIKDGFEYGTTKGTLGGNLSNYPNAILNCSFTQQDHKIRIFDAQTLKQIKEDQTLTIRSPREFKNILTKYVILFFTAWWGLWFISRVRKKSLDDTIVSILMVLTGLCLLTMFSLNAPLTDKLLGVDMAQGIIVGVILIAILHNVNFKKLYQNQSLIDFDIPIECIKWIFKPFKLKVSYLIGVLLNRSSNIMLKCLALLCIVICLPMFIFDLIKLTSLNSTVSKFFDRQPKGIGYLLTALLLTALLFTPLGVAVGGMKVNLNMGILFQPSEIAKYLIIFFMAGYFSVNANKIVQFSEKGNNKLFGTKLKMLMSILIGLGVLMGLYLVLGDIGPALVLAFTFIILYSIIKSKVDLEGSTPDNQLRKIFTCDIAMLIYGILSFIVFLYIGNYLGNMGIFCLVWFVIWIILGITKQQIYETPIFFNFIVAAFIFGSSILGNIPGLDSVANRLDSRNEMCTNTWGILPIDGNIADAGENTQVAEGLWGLASGGLWGQGLGNGSPHFIPAFHTDMILESIGEQMGFVGVFFIIILLAILLRKAIVLGYKTSHPFTFYLCMGIAIVTAIQFIIISLGSTGIIPLTGVTVPFFSYGKVSMILNLAAYGIILSIASHTNIATISTNETIAKLTKQNISKYNYSVSLLSWTYCILAVIISGVFFYYQFIDRNDTLIRPVYVNNSSGIPIVEYNPRIEQLTQKMHSGDIYDRNGVLLATSDKTKLKEFKDIYSDLQLDYDTLKRQQRYYPFGEHLYFILGDYCSKLFFSSSEMNPRGYMAEARHLTELRGYDNVLRNSLGEPVKINLYSSSFNPGKFYSANYNITQNGIQLRDYSSLIPYLKAGMNSDKVTRLNNRETGFWEIGEIEPKDIQLTVDAVLQTKLQDAMNQYANKLQFESSKWNKLRMSIVVIDAHNGDMLASANYPLPDYEILKSAPDTYSDNYKDESWVAYTERDLGLTRPTAPGSTAKVMSALAGLRKLGVECANPNDKEYYYYVDPEEKVGLEPSGFVTMQKAIVKSSNCYFINLVNDHNLYDDLAYIYRTVGVELNGNMSYYFNYNDCPSENKWENQVTREAGAAISAYDRYVEKGIKEKMSKHPAWFWAWGQGTLWATPMAMARVSSIVVNNGEMPITKFVLNQETQTIPVVSSDEAKMLNLFMKEEAQEKSFTNSNIGGKTGTAERYFWNHKKRRTSPNDGWFMCFIENSTVTKNINGELYEDTVPLAVAVRMERLGSGMSGQAVSLTKDVVMTVLSELGYIK